MQPQEQPVITIGQLQIRYLMDGTATGAGMGMFELIVHPAPEFRRHTAIPNNEEVVYVLDGVLRYTVDSETRDLQPGERMYTPRGSVHAFNNPHEKTARALIILTPDIGAQYFRDIAEVVTAPSGPNQA